MLSFAIHFFKLLVLIGESDGNKATLYTLVPECNETAFCLMRKKLNSIVLFEEGPLPYPPELQGHFCYPGYLIAYLLL